MKVGIVSCKIPATEEEIVLQEQLSGRGVAADPVAYLPTTVAEILAAIPLADPKASSRSRQMAAILQRTEVTVIEVLCEMKMPEGIAGANRDWAVRYRKPAQPLCPLTLGPISV